MVFISYILATCPEGESIRLLIVFFLCVVYILSQLTARNCYLLEKSAESLSENEKIIRRSLEKVDSWLRELPATFPPIHDVMTPYSLIENRV